MDESRKQNPQPNKRRSPLEALLKPIAFLLSIPARKKAKKAEKKVIFLVTAKWDRGSPRCLQVRRI